MFLMIYTIHSLCLQHQLECALLGLGQFQNTLDELHTWLSRTTEQLQGSQPISIDLQACEIELAKHKVGGGLNKYRYTVTFQSSLSVGYFVNAGNFVCVCVCLVYCMLTHHLSESSDKSQK